MGASRACILWHKSVHVRNYLVKLCPNIMGGGGAPISTPLAHNLKHSILIHIV